ncbi:hypothetical protein WJX73_008922 [Symbiochloris irregularis]|uniref:Uncharacterized protein n=1 Tax=Symbiochloris irregularis TaxID=706552 RepID=A0AAW1NRN6_9CHLO
MGVTTSSPDQLGLDQDEPVVEGVRVTSGLLAQLSGSRRRAVPARPSGPPIVVNEPPGEPSRTEEEVLALMRRDRELQQALQRSRRAGDLLLKAEEDEVAAVNQLVSDLLQKEYRGPVREAPCRREHAKCLQCYQHNPADPLKCATAVQAYAQCAHAAQATPVR